MSVKTASSTVTPIKELTITRVFNAPRNLVFKVWTNAEHLAKWWEPHHFTSAVREFDASRRRDPRRYARPQRHHLRVGRQLRRNSQLLQSEPQPHRITGGRQNSW